MEEEINLVDFYYILKRRFKSILIIVLVFLCATYVCLRYTTKFYEATSTILPIGGDQGGSIALLAQVANMTGNSFGSPGKLIELPLILSSRSLAERVVTKLDLFKHYYSQSWDFKNNQWNKNLKEVPTIHDAAEALLSNVSVEGPASDRLLTISVQDKDPEMALEINRTILSELQSYLSNSTLTEAKKQRIFIGNQLVNNKKELLEIGRELGGFYQKNNISTISPFMDVDLVLPDISLDSELEDFQIRMNDKIKQLQNQKERLTNNRSWRVKKVPQQAYFDFLQLKKQILISLNGMLSQQYEMAKMQEIKEDISFKIIDEAIKPKKPSKPKKIKIMAIALFASLFISFLYAFMAEYVLSLQQKTA